MDYILNLKESLAIDAVLTGGKGSNLAQLVQANFPVPGGFVVTTNAYSAFIEADGLQHRLSKILEQVDYEDAVQLDETMIRVRELIHCAVMPIDVQKQLLLAYAELGEKTYVAVRSSGTAEDLADASFAGLHDTYLDIHGIEDVLDAVKRCWASMWTARATSYRNAKGIEHHSAQIAVVVQTMVDSETSGVLFTANPMTADVDEIAINASWGLGEGIVSGITTPDYFILSAANLAVQEQVLGSKELRIVRNPETGLGTITQDVPDADRTRFSLTDDELKAVADLGRRVETYYDKLPQDIEWACVGGEVFLLQSRPITGVEISWDSHVDKWQTLADRDDIVWTRSWADEQWTGAITPLFYSWRADMFTAAYSRCSEIWGVPEMVTGRMFKYYQGEAYFSSDLERAIIEKTVFPALRLAPHVLNHVPAPWHDEVMASPFSILRYLKMQGRIASAGDPANTPYEFLRVFDNYFNARADEADGLSSEELQLLSDEALIDYAERCIAFEIEFAKDLWAGYYLYARDAFGALGWMLENWYTGENTLAFGELMTGTPKRTATLEENLQLWGLAEKIRDSVVLRQAFDNHVGEDFFKALEESDEGRDFLVEYKTFSQANSHRGHAERDIYFARRLEDPAIDYRAWQTMLSGESVDHEGQEAEINARREQVIDEVVANMRRRPFGGLRADVFKLVLEWTLQFLVVRDDERYLIDRSTYAAKRGFLEMGKRLQERKMVESDRDFYFLSRAELYDLFRRDQTTPLFRAKIGSRMKNFDRFLNREAKLPMYLQAGKAVDLSASEVEHEDGVLKGIGTSHGKVTGRARIVHDLSEIGRVKKGEILITNHTDPGWTPVFLVIGGIVLETGGMLAHGSLLAREYGFPAVQVANATELITDGALITVDGDTGRVLLLPDEEALTDTSS